MTNDICNICGSVKEIVPAGKRKDGTSFKAFMGCPNWKSHKDTQKAEKPVKQPFSGNSGASTSKFDALMLEIKEVQDLIWDLKEVVDEIRREISRGRNQD